MKAIEQRKTSIIRVFEDDAEYGDKFVLSLFATYYGKYNHIVVLEGLEHEMNIYAMSALRTLFRNTGVHEVKWDHTNNRGLEMMYCYNVVTGKLRVEH